MKNAVNKRIKELLNKKGLSDRQFAMLLDMPQTTISNMFIRDSAPKSDVLEKILETYSGLSAEWLLRGKGPMYCEQTEEVETRPRIPFDAAAGTLTVGVDGVMPYQCEQMPVVRAFPRYDFTILVRGESMAPEYQSGDEVACLYVRESTYTQWGRVHVLDTTQGVVIKRIYDRGDMVLCKSDNPRYEDFSIPKSEVFNIALVIGLIRRY